jgi:hypothetical protein
MVFRPVDHSIWMPGWIKHTQITEHQSIEFRAETTNVFNHAAFVFVWLVLPILTESSALVRSVEHHDEPIRASGTVDSC